MEVTIKALALGLFLAQAAHVSKDHSSYNCCLNTPEGWIPRNDWTKAVCAMRWGSVKPGNVINGDDFYTACKLYGATNDMESTESRGLPYDVLFEDASQDYTTPLPTPNDIESREIIPNREWANNMLYVAKHTTIPVPRVYAIYQRKENKKTITYILMEYIPGKSLVDLWCDIDCQYFSRIFRSASAIETP
ncbi:hypothetical protein IWW34DRAFT_809084 [Fusarium oxysporum f. sp. albedinis]|nr:hypothetical protein IWW34DRAFT_809084 [Fusarium oxysporum f. sp. albedinis]